MRLTTRMLQEEPSDADMDWTVAEMMKTPTWIAEAVYSDFVMADCAKILPAVEIPLILFGADSQVFPTGTRMAKALAAQAPHGTFLLFEDGGHMLFYEQPQKFNAALAAFAKAPK